MGMFSERIGMSTCSNIEIADELKKGKKMKNNYYDDTRICEIAYEQILAPSIGGVYNIFGHMDN